MFNFLIPRIKLLLLTLFLFSLISCTGSVPEIGRSLWQINWVRTPLETSGHQELSVFTLIEDEDGIEDIDFIYLIHDDMELFWKLNIDEWIKKIFSGKNWIGSNSIRMNNNSKLPSGNYRLVVIDKAGERDSTSFNIPKNMLNAQDPKYFPKLLISSDIVIESKFSDNTLWIYDNEMKLIKNLKIESGIISTDIINKDTSNKASWISIYSFDSENGIGLITGPYSF